MTSSSGDEIEEGLSKKLAENPQASTSSEEILCESPTYDTPMKEYFPSQSKSNASRAQTPPYTSWKTENIHLFTQELQSSFGRKLQNSNEIVCPPTSNHPRASGKHGRQQYSDRDFVDNSEEPAFSPSPDKWRSPQMEPDDRTLRCSGCCNPSPPQQRKGKFEVPVVSDVFGSRISTRLSPCQPQKDSCHTHSFQPCHCSCSSVQVHPRRSHEYRVDFSPPRRRRNTQEKKDVTLDLHRIVLLLNQQLGEVQSQVKKLTEKVDRLQKENLENRTIREPPKPSTSSTGVQTFNEEKLSVGVMTCALQAVSLQKGTEGSSSSGETPTSSSSASSALRHRNDRRRSRSRKSKQLMSIPSLRPSDIPAVVARPPSPPASVHVEMPEFDSTSSSSSSYESSYATYSEDESADENGEFRGPPNVGWTYYDAIVGKVNELLSESSNTGGQCDNDAIKQATLDHLISIGVSFDLQQGHKRVTFGNKQMPVLQKANDDTDTSMRLNALALKYLNDQTIKQHGPKSKLYPQTSSYAANNTNFSFATMRYLERHQLVPGQPASSETVGSKSRKVRNVSDDPQRHFELRRTHSKKKRHSRKDERSSNKNNRTGEDQINKILDVSAIKNQPKLLPKRH